MNILFVDDNADTREAVELFFEMTEWQYVIAQNGLEALDALV